MTDPELPTKEQASRAIGTRDPARRRPHDVFDIPFGLIVMITAHAQSF